MHPPLCLRRGRVIVLIAPGLLASPLVLAQPTIVDLGVIDGGPYSIGAAVSADGSAVAGTCGIASGERAFAGQRRAAW